MDDMYTKCKNCGKTKREHRAKSFNCPSETAPGRKVFLDNSIFIGVLSSEPRAQVKKAKVYTSRLDTYNDDQEHQIDRGEAVHLFGTDLIQQIDKDEPLPGKVPRLSSHPDMLCSDGHLEPLPSLDDEFEEDNPIGCEPPLDGEFYAPLSSSYYVYYTPSRRYYPGWTIRGIYRVYPKDLDSFEPGEPNYYIIQHHTAR